MFSWFHGIITKDQVDVLLSPRRDGHYLVRESTSCPGTYILAVWYDLVEINTGTEAHANLLAGNQAYGQTF